MVMLSSRLSSYPLSADSASRPLGRDGLESSLLSMQSNQPQPGQQLPVPQETPPNGQQNPYEFIFEQPGKPKRSLSGSKMTRILVVAGGAFLLLIVVIIVFSFISNSGKSTTEALIGLAEEQTEIIRVATTGATKAREASARNLAVTTQYSMQTTQGQTVALLKKQGHKLGAKELTLKKSAQTDAQLAAAAENNTFDQTFITIMQSSLSTYRTDVKKAYDNSINKTERQILANSFNGVNIILGQSTQVQAN